jgi:hypothetical protein
MSTVTYAYAVDSIVYHVDDAKGVRKGVVRKVTMTVIPGGSPASILYVIAFTDARDGIIDALEPTLFADVDLALAYYKTTYVIV